MKVTALISADAPFLISKHPSLELMMVVSMTDRLADDPVTRISLVVNEQRSVSSFTPCWEDPLKAHPLSDVHPCTAIRMPCGPEAVRREKEVSLISMDAFSSVMRKREEAEKVTL